MFESQNESFNIKFVRAVEKYPVLYDFTRTDYSKKEVTQKAWSEIAKEFQLSEYECKERWRNFRTLYVRHAKAGKNKSKTNFRRPYYLGNAMKFLDPFIRGNGNLLPTFIEDSGVTIKQDCSDLNKPSALATPPLSQPINTCEESRFKSQDSKITPANSSTSKTLLKTISVNGNVSGNVNRDPNEYFMNKMPKLIITTPKVNKKESAVQQFLNSLIPDLMTMTDAQLRTYKRSTILLIDDILRANPLEVHCTQELESGNNLSDLNKQGDS